MGSSILTSKIHESGQCGSPACSRVRGRGRPPLPALDSAHMPQQICAALICAQCEIQLAMPQVQPEAPQRQEMTKNKRERRRNKNKIRNCEKCIFTSFVGVRQSGPWSTHTRLHIPVDHFGFRANIVSPPLGHIAIFIEVGTKPIVSYKDPEYYLCCNAEQSERL